MRALDKKGNGGGSRQDEWKIGGISLFGRFKIMSLGPTAPPEKKTRKRTQQRLVPVQTDLLYTTLGYYDAGRFQRATPDAV